MLPRNGAQKYIFLVLWLFVFQFEKAHGVETMTPLRVCSGSSATIVEMSQPFSHTICSSQGKCTSGNIYRYAARCANGAYFDGPHIYAMNPGVDFDYARIDGNTLILGVGKENGQELESRFPAGYAPLPVNVGFYRDGVKFLELKEADYKGLGEVTGFLIVAGFLTAMLKRKIQSNTVGKISSSIFIVVTGIVTKVILSAYGYESEITLYSIVIGAGLSITLVWSLDSH